jgi:four helix bundle protein
LPVLPKGKRQKEKGKAVHLQLKMRGNVKTERRRIVRDIRERTFDFALRIVKLCQQLDSQPGVARTLGRQLLKSGTSVGANMEEAQAGQSKLDFISKNAIALKEARETVFWLRLLAAAKIMPAGRLSELQTEAVELSKIIGSIVVSAKRKKVAL